MEDKLTIVSRRILKPILGKNKLAMERAAKYKNIMVSQGIKARLGTFIGGELNGCLQLTAIYSDMTTATKSFTELSKNEEIIEMMSIREDDPSEHLIGSEVYRTIFGQPSNDNNFLLIRECDVDRKYIPQTFSCRMKWKKLERMKILKF